MALTNRQFLLTKLMEECAEVAQRAAKSMQFGPYNIQDGQLKNNAQRLSDEVRDLITILLMLRQQTQELPNDALFGSAFDAKVAKVAKYKKFSQELGMVEADA